MNEDEQLNQVLANAQENAASGRNSYPQGVCSTPESASQKLPQLNSIEFRQWQIGANDTFRPAGLTRELLPPGIYAVEEDNYGLYLQLVRVVTDALIHLPDSANDRVLQSMQTFWRMEKKYREHGLLYKRGVLLWGPPGSGKTATLQLLSHQLLKAGGIVVLCNHPRRTSAGLAAIRRIEPTRRIICIIEDIDEVISLYSEHELLALLDGENQVDNIVMIATTNYPERLGARIVNRPSRFDERIFVGMPSVEARRTYLRSIATAITPEDLAQWIKDTDGLSIAHLRELAAAVLCLEQPYEVVISRLRSMRQRPQEKSGFNDQPVGFTSATGRVA